ncbi:MAG: hypothetical protein Q7S33_01185 [Nanoarchaeota archaeon]|nr:hypothetical protein [Nanoarchaeota archaeon]
MEYKTITVDDNLRIYHWGELPVLIKTKASGLEVLGFAEPLSELAIGEEIKYNPMHPVFVSVLRYNRFSRDKELQDLNRLDLNRK